MAESSYKKTIWHNGDVIDEARLNNIEDGIAALSGGDSPYSQDIRDYVAASMAQKGQKYITLRPIDFTELYSDGKYLQANSSDPSISNEATSSSWKIYQYDLGRPFVLRADRIVKSSVGGVVPIAFRYKGVNYTVDYDRLGFYYIADTVLVSYYVDGEAFAIDEFSFTESVRREFDDVAVCGSHVSEFDSIVAFGDSIFEDYISYSNGNQPGYGNGTMHQLAELMGIPLYIHAVADSTLTTKHTDYKNTVAQIQDYIASPDGGKTPLFIIEGGTNDQYHDGVSNLGVYGSDDAKTIYGAIKTAINNLLGIGVQPWQILVCTPIPKGIRGITNGSASFSSAGYLAEMDYQLTTIGYAMYEVAIAQMCNVVNGYNAIFDKLSSAYLCRLIMGDDTHPTTAGAEYYARHIYNLLHSGLSLKGTEAEIDNLNDKLDDAVDLITNNEVSWELGLINASTGADAAGDTRIRTTDYIPATNLVDIVIGNGSKIAMRAYDANKGYLYGIGSWHTESFHLMDKVSQTSQAENVKYIRFVAAYSDDRTVADVSDLATYISIEHASGIDVSGMKSDIGVLGEKLDVETAKITGEIEALKSTISTISDAVENVADIITNDEVSWELGLINASTGADANAANRIRTPDYIVVSNLVNVVIRDGAKIAMRAYDANKGYLYGIGSWHTESFHLMDKVSQTSQAENVGYVRFVGGWSDDRTVSNVSALSDYITIEHAISNVSQATQGVSEKIDRVISRLDEDDAVQVYTTFEALSQRWSGTTLGDSTALRHSAGVRVTPGRTYYVGNIGQTASGTLGCFLDGAGDPVSALTTADVSEYSYTLTTDNPSADLTRYSKLYRFTAPEGCYYLSINLPYSDADMWKMFIASKPLFRLGNTGNLIVRKDSPMLQKQDKRLCVVGPSFAMIDRRTQSAMNNQTTIGFQEYLWPYYKDVTTFGYSGGAWGQFGDESYISIYSGIVTGYGASVPAKDFTPFDEVLLIGCNPNGFFSTPRLEEGVAGTWAENTSPVTSFMGGLRGVVEYILAQKPTMKIYLANFWHTSGSVGQAYRETCVNLNAEMLKLANLFGLQYIDLYNSTPFNKYNYTTANKLFSYDGVHPNQAGLREIADVLVRAMIGG